MPCTEPFQKEGENEAENKVAITIPINPHYLVIKELLKEVRTKIDCTAPNFKTEVLFKSKKLGEDLKRFKEIIDENLELLIKINTITRTTGRTDNYNEKLDGVRSARNAKYRLERIAAIESQNIQFAETFKNTPGFLPTRKQLLEEWNETLGKIRESAKFPIVLPDLHSEDIVSKTIENPNRPLIYLDITEYYEKKGRKNLGRLIIVLFFDIAPVMVSNFIRLCLPQENNKNNNTNGNNGDYIEMSPTLLGTTFYRIFPDLYLEGGDMLYENGCGGLAADGASFVEDDNQLDQKYLVDYSCKGTLSMIANNDGLVNSLFLLTFKPFSFFLNRKYGIGRVIKGLKTLDAIESYGTKNGKPNRLLYISNCGLLSTSFEGYKQFYN